jgi:hypothetical protein
MDFVGPRTVHVIELSQPRRNRRTRKSSSETAITLWKRHGAMNGVGDTMLRWRVVVSRLLGLRFFSVLVSVFAQIWLWAEVKLAQKKSGSIHVAVYLDRREPIEGEKQKAENWPLNTLSFRKAFAFSPSVFPPLVFRHVALVQVRSRST